MEKEKNVQIQNLVVALFGQFVLFPDEIQTHAAQEQDDQGIFTLVNVKVAQKDIGLCIGVGGKTADAIRRVIGIIGHKQFGERIFVKIDAPKFPKSHFE